MVEQKSGYTLCPLRLRKGRVAGKVGDSLCPRTCEYHSLNRVTERDLQQRVITPGEVDYYTTRDAYPNCYQEKK